MMKYGLKTCRKPTVAGKFFSSKINAHAPRRLPISSDAIAGNKPL